MNLEKEIEMLMKKWLNDTQKLINKARRTVFNSKYEELIAKIEQSQEMYDELSEIYYKHTDNK